MLQIISGKFFKTGNCHTSVGHGILYSNYSWPCASIQTCIGSLENTEHASSSITPYIFTYDNKIEKKENAQGLDIVRVGDSEIIQQFKIICIFGLQAWFDTDRNNAFLNCRQQPIDANDIYVPAFFVRRFFRPQLSGNINEINGFIELMDKIIGLSRKDYETVVSSLSAFSQALQVLNYNFELAYSMMVFSIESLAQAFDADDPQWEDFDQNIKKKMDALFKKIEPETTKEIKTILLDGAKLKLSHKFCAFVERYTADSFFIVEAYDIPRALRKSELSEAIKNAYSMRSKYAHQLLEIQNQLKFPPIAKGEIYYLDNKPFLTFTGLTRLAHHVIREFIYSRQTVVKEKHNWPASLPGHLNLNLDPKYWVNNQDRFTPSNSNIFLTGFIQDLMAQHANIKEKGLSDMRKLLKKCETLFHHAKPDEQLSMFALYFLYNESIEPKFRNINYNEFFNAHKTLFKECSFEAIVVWILLRLKWDWSVNECEAAYQKYLEAKFSKHTIQIPAILEVCIIIKLANIYLEDRQFEQYDNHINMALKEAAGQKDIQDSIQKAKKEQTIINWKPWIFKAG